MKRTLTAIVALPLALGAPACVGKSSKISEAELAQLKQYVLDTKPNPPNKLDIDYDGKVTLLGYKI